MTDPNVGSHDVLAPLAESPVIGLLGGTGDQGLGLAYRWSGAGISVMIGSRDAKRAAQAASSLPGSASGDSNLAVAEACDIAVIAVPWAGHADLISALPQELAGKIVIDCVNPLGFDKRGAFALPVPEGSAAEQAQQLLPDSVVVGAFHNVSSVLLKDESLAEVATDTLVLGDVKEATDEVQRLAAMIPGMRGVFGGRLRNSSQIEALTANLISINRRYKAHAGIRITDVN
ncbi:MAG: NADPH-dependent F420 reductase [Micrococcales bacterium]|nr:NADPH-dependent F420 reductase [Micrococcales bacterium]